MKCQRIALVALFALLLWGAPQSRADTPVALRLLETTDIHMYLTDEDFLRDRRDVGFGLSRTASLIDEARREVPNTLLMDAGDLIEGNPMGDTVAAPGGLPDGVLHPAYRVFALLGYDVATLGNHEFNYGVPFLTRVLQGVPFPVVSANVVRVTDGKPFIAPYVILKRQLVDAAGVGHAIRIGVIGLVTPQILVWDRDNLKGRLNALDIGETARRLVPQIRAEGADVVVALVHSGWWSRPPSAMDENSVEALSHVAGIDAILFGHTHLAFPGPSYAGRTGADLAHGTINGIPATQAGYWGSHLGLVDLSLAVDAGGHWHVLDGRGSVRAITRRDDGKIVPAVVPEDRIADAVAVERAATVQRLSQPLGQAEAPLNTFFAFLHPDPVTRLIAAAQAWYIRDMLKGTPFADLPVLSAAAPFKAGGRIGTGNFTDIAAGPVTVKSLADAYPYPNTVQAVVATGAQVVEWLEMGTLTYTTIVAGKAGAQPLFNGNMPSYGFDTLYGGLTYTIDVTQPPRYAGDGTLLHPDSHRVGTVLWQGRPIDPNARFVIATNNYRAGGGGHFAGLDGSTVVFAGADETRKVMANYVLSVKTIAASGESPWRLAPLPAETMVVYDTSPAAAAQAAADPMLRPIGPSDNGMSRYQVVP